MTGNTIRHRFTESNNNRNNKLGFVLFRCALEDMVRIQLLLCPFHQSYQYSLLSTLLLIDIPEIRSIPNDRYIFYYKNNAIVSSSPIILVSHIDVGNVLAAMLQKDDIRCFMDNQFLSFDVTSLSIHSNKCTDGRFSNKHTSLDLSGYTNLQELTIGDNSFNKGSSLKLPASLKHLVFGRNTFGSLNSLPLPSSLTHLTLSEGSVNGMKTVSIKGHQQLTKIVFRSNAFKTGSLLLESACPSVSQL